MYLNFLTKFHPCALQAPEGAVLDMAVQSGTAESAPAAWLLTTRGLHVLSADGGLTNNTVLLDSQLMACTEAYPPICGQVKPTRISTAESPSMNESHQCRISVYIPIMMISSPPSTTHASAHAGCALGRDLHGSRRIWHHRGSRCAGPPLPAAARSARTRLQQLPE